MSLPLDLSNAPRIGVNRAGRPLGAVNYSGISLIARTMKANGVMWLDELVKSYKLYRDESLALTAEQKAGGLTPDQTMLKFWMEMVPYISLKMNEKEQRGWKPRKNKKRISKAAFAALERMEGRKE